MRRAVVWHRGPGPGRGTCTSPAPRDHRRAPAPPRPPRRPAARSSGDVASALAARDDGPAEHGRPAVAELLGLHGLTLAAVRDGIEAEVTAYGVDVHEVAAAVRPDPPGPIETAELAGADLAELAGG